MSNNLENSRRRRESSHVFINGIGEISGVQSYQASFNDISSPINHVGLTSQQIYPNGPRQGSISLNYIPLHSDVFLPFITGNSGLNGFCLRNQQETNENYSFISGFISSYSHKCAVGALPETEITFNVLDNLGRISGDNDEIINNFSFITGSTGLGQAKVATFSSIDITLDNATIDRVNSYSLDMTVSRIPTYAIGNPNPIRVDISYPIEVIFNTSIDLYNYTPGQMMDYPCSTRVNNLVLSLKDHQTSEEYIRYSFNDLILIGQNYRINVDGNTSLDLQYKTYLTRPITGYSPITENCISPHFGTGSTTSTVTDPPNSCPSGNCHYDSGLSFNYCSSGLQVTGLGNHKFGVGYSIVHSGVNYGYVEFEYFHPCTSRDTDFFNCLTCGNWRMICDGNGQEVMDAEFYIYYARLKKFQWNFDYLDLNPPPGTIFMPGYTRQDVFADSCFFTDPNNLCGKDWHTYPFYVQMEDCTLNFCIDLPERIYSRCGDPTTPTTSTSSTTTPTTTTTTTTTPTTTTTSTTTPTTTTTTTTSTTTTTTSTTTTTTPTTTTTTTTTTTLPPCPIDCSQFSDDPVYYPLKQCQEISPGVFACGDDYIVGDNSQQEWCGFLTNLGGGDYLEICPQAFAACGIQDIITALCNCEGSTVCFTITNISDPPPGEGEFVCCSSCGGLGYRIRITRI